MSANGRVVTLATQIPYALRDRNNPDWSKNDLRGRDVYVFRVDDEEWEVASVSSAGEYVDGISSAEGGGSWMPQVSANGRFVTFYSTSRELIPQDNNGRGDFFIRDLWTYQTKRVASAQDDHLDRTPSIYSKLAIRTDNSGKRIVFESYADDLFDDGSEKDVDLFVTQGPPALRATRFPRGIRASLSDVHVETDRGSGRYTNGVLTIRNERRRTVRVGCSIATLGFVEAWDRGPRDPMLDDVFGTKRITMTLAPRSLSQRGFTYPVWIWPGWPEYAAVVRCDKVPR
jgi:hypothetical protein